MKDKQIARADDEWYAAQSLKQSVPKHCPMAANDKCPRYFLSQKHADAAGALTLHLEVSDVVKLGAQWATSDAFSVSELTVGTWLRSDGTLRGVENFCPEVTARIFGLYCSSLRAFPDEPKISKRQPSPASERVIKPEIQEWMIVEPKHFTDCHEFSVYGAGSRTTKPKTKRETLSSRTRFQVLHRDGYKCVYCGVTGDGAALHVDHKVSVAEGGSDEMTNLVTACQRCNLGKGSKSVI